MLPRLLAAAALLASSAVFAGPITARQAPGVIKKELKAQVDDSYRWTVRLGGKPGETTRPFTANNLHVLRPRAKPGATPLGVAVGHTVEGKINLNSAKVKVDRDTVPR